MFDVERYLRERKALIDSALARYLTQKRRCPRRLREAMCYGIFAGGKRIRPILTLASGEVFGAQKSSLLPVARAIEFIHAYSPIHDDLPAYPAIVGIDAAKRRAQELMRACVSELEIFGTAAGSLPAIARYVVERKA